MIIYRRDFECMGKCYRVVLRCLYMSIYIYVYICPHIFLHTNIRIYIHIYIYIYINTYIYMNIYIYTSIGETLNAWGSVIGLSMVQDIFLVGIAKVRIYDIYVCLCT
jgi:hypothetical protein